MTAVITNPQFIYIAYFQEHNFIYVSRSVPQQLEYLSKWQQWFPDGCRMTPSEQVRGDTDLKNCMI
jgi:hypothetical protein